MDTGDLILHKSTGTRYIVACRHDTSVRVAGPHVTLHVDDCELIEAATHEQRMQALKTMAASSMPGHRPQCARERINEAAAE